MRKMYTTKRLLGTVACAALLAVPALAIPNQIGGFLAQTDSPLNDRDLTDVLLADGLWAGEVDLPGKWRNEAPIADVGSSYLLARPKVFDQPALLVEAAKLIPGLLVGQCQLREHVRCLNKRVAA